MAEQNIEMSAKDTKSIPHSTNYEDASSNEEEAVFKGHIDPVYEAKANMLNKSVCDIPSSLI